MIQTLCDRLVEAGVELLHLNVRKHIWGYSLDEDLSIAALHAERFQGIRPAVGYPSLPDQSINFILDSLLNFKDIDGEDNGGLFESKTDKITIYDEDYETFPIFIDLPPYRLTWFPRKSVKKNLVSL